MANVCFTSVYFYGSQNKLSKLSDALLRAFQSKEDIKNVSLKNLIDSLDIKNIKEESFLESTFFQFDLDYRGDFYYEVDENDLVRLVFETAWFPPLKIITLICEKFNVTAEYYGEEPMCDVFFTNSNRVIIDDDRYDTCYYFRRIMAIIPTLKIPLKIVKKSKP